LRRLMLQVVQRGGVVIAKFVKCHGPADDCDSPGRALPNSGAWPWWRTSRQELVKAGKQLCPDESSSRLKVALLRPGADKRFKIVPERPVSELARKVLQRQTSSEPGGTIWSKRSEDIGRLEMQVVECKPQVEEVP